MTEAKAIIKVPAGWPAQLHCPKASAHVHLPGQGFYLGTELGRVWIKIPAGTKAGDTVEAKIPIEVNASTIAEVVEVKLVAGR